MKIKVDEATCIGCGACTTTAGDRIEMKANDKGEQKAFVKKNDFNDSEVKELIELCPVDAISAG